MAVADLDGDDRLDVVESQGEVPGHEDERVYLASDVIPVDAAPPIIRWELVGVDRRPRARQPDAEHAARLAIGHRPVDRR